MEKVTLQFSPEVKAIVSAAFPDYRKRVAYVAAFGGRMNINSFWDGGSRSEYAIVDLASFRRKALPTATHPYFDIAVHGLANQESQAIESDQAGNCYLKALPEGFAIVQAGTFCGKSATAFIYVNPANLAKLLKA